MTIKNINMENYIGNRMTEWDYTLKIGVLADKQESMDIFAQDILPDSVDIGSAPEVKFLVQDISINDHKCAKLQIWLFSCQDRFIPIRRMQIRGSNGIILIFDSRDNKSIDKVSEHISFVREILPDVPFILIDLSNQEISKEFKETHNISDSIVFSSEAEVKKIFLSLMKMILQDELDENYFSLEPIRESRKEYINPFRAVRELTEELIKKRDSIKIGGDKLFSRRTCISILIIWFVLYTSFIILFLIY